MDFTLEPYDCRYSHPHPPRAIKLNGVVIGHLLDFDGPLDERVKAVGGDEEIQTMLDDWYAKLKRMKDAVRRSYDTEYAARMALARKDQRAAARKALGLD